MDLEGSSSGHVPGQVSDAAATSAVAYWTDLSLSLRMIGRVDLVMEDLERGAIMDSTSVHGSTVRCSVRELCDTRVWRSTNRGMRCN